MTGSVLVDTGPLVAILARGDQHHEICVERLHLLVPPMLTCWPVVTEAAWLLRRDPATVQALLRSFDSGFLRLLPLEEESIAWIARFLHRYQNVHAQLADAALAWLAERHSITTIFTLDRHDFAIYRLSRGRCFQVVP
jgi:predicted nucleic acid-binding protein